MYRLTLDEVFGNIQHETFILFMPLILLPSNAYESSAVQVGPIISYVVSLMVPYPVPILDDAIGKMLLGGMSLYPGGSEAEWVL